MAENEPCGPGPHSHYSEPVEVCPVIEGFALVTRVQALEGKGSSHWGPLGIASGILVVLACVCCLL